MCYTKNANHKERSIRQPRNLKLGSPLFCTVLS
jgi:hypothetical protein